MVFLDVNHLKTYFDTSKGTVKAVDDVSLNVKENEMVGLVGESGSGKSMTALSIMRLVPRPGKILSGQITFRDQDLLGLDDEAMRQIRGGQMAMIFQDPMTYLNPIMKVGDQVAEAILAHKKVTKQEAFEIAVEALHRVRTPSYKTTAECYPYQLSGGMLQRVLIAMAISCAPSLLIADEPTTALDVTVQRQILELIKQLRKEFSVSTLLITHDLGIVSEICDRIYVMYAGRILEHGDVFSILERPKHPYTSGLLDSVLSIDECKDELVSIGGSTPDMANLPSGCKFHPRCPSATATCAEREPALKNVAPNQSAACWLY